MTQLKDNRNCILCLLLNIVTFGIYSLYLFSVVARDTNVACADDGKKTSGLLKIIIFSLLTFGIYAVVWQCLVISRWDQYVTFRGDKPALSVVLHVVLNIVLSAFLIPIIIDFVLFVKGFNQVCFLHNRVANAPVSTSPTKNPPPPVTPYKW